MRSPLWVAAFYAATFVVGIFLGWQIDCRLGEQAAPHAPVAGAHEAAGHS